MKLFLVLSLAFSLAFSAAAAPRRGPRPKAKPDDGRKPMIHWDCDKAFPRASDLPFGKSPSGSAIGGFADESKRLHGFLATADKPKQAIPEAWTFQCFVRDPHPLPDRPALVARFEDGPAGSPPAVAWQLWIERSGALCLGVEDAKGVRSVARHAGAPWRPGVWHHVAIVRELGEKDAEGAREDRYRVWVVPLASPAALSAAPEPLIDHRLVTRAAPFRMSSLAVGGGAAGKHPETAPAGALGGFVDEVSLWPRALSGDELATSRTAFVKGGSAAAEAVAAADAPPMETLLCWTFGEKGPKPVAKDASGHGRDGRSGDRVRASNTPGRGGRGGSFEGFSTEGSSVSSPPLPDGTFRGDWTFLAWVRNPRLSSKQACVLASSDPAARVGNIAWRLWFDSKGVPHVGAQDASSRRYSGAGTPVAFEREKWHLVALTHRRGKGNQGGVRDFFQVFVVPDGARASVPPAPALDWSYGGAQLAKGSMLVVGASPAGAGKRAETAPGGFFGGQIGEVAFFAGRALGAKDVAELAKKKSLAE